MFAVALLPFLALLAALLLSTGDGLHAQEVEPSGAYRADINPLLAQDLAEAGAPVSFLVVLRDQLDPAAVLADGGLQNAPAAQRRAALYAALTGHAERSQASLRAWLTARGVPYQPHYLVNMVEVQGDEVLAEQLRLRRDVQRLARNPSVRQTHTAAAGGRWPVLIAALNRFTQGASEASEAPRPFTAAHAAAATAHAAAAAAQTAAAGALPGALPYGLVYTNADDVWALGIRGQGIVVASQDTGVQWDHPALRDVYRGWNTQTQTVTHPYNWYDAFGRDQQDTFAGCDPNAQVPCDDSGHGTHTVGTMLGDATNDSGPILGMAPAAEWIACRNMRGGIGTPASYTACFEWFLAPYPQGGNPLTDGKPELSPHVVNNSWGCPPNEGCDAESLRQVVDTVRAGGIFIAASAGNGAGFGGSCRTVQDPIGIYDSSFTVGAHDENGAIAYFSSRGPVAVDGSNRRKPDLSAPGVSVFSSTRFSSYRFESGTSMASPHLAGAVALLWSAVPQLIGDIDRTEQLLLKGATPVADNECDPGQPVSPNNVYGFGRLNILDSVNMARLPVTLTVSVVTSDSVGVAGRQVQLIDKRTGFSYFGVTDAQGKATWAPETAGANLFAGSYDVRVQDCTSSIAAGSVNLSPGQSRAETVPTAFAACVIMPQIYRP
jgi:subtilisin family serine protease